MGKEMKYEWNLSFRIDHWVRFVAIGILIFTGFYTHSPFIKGGPDSYLYVWMRCFHILAAYTLVLGFIVRVYLAFNSRFSPDWKDFSIGKNLAGVPDTLAYYLFIKGTYKDTGRYNPLQALGYLFMCLMIIFMGISGSALYRGFAFGFLNGANLFAWFTNLMGGLSYVRIWHYLGMWIFIIFILVHVYLSLITSVAKRDKSFTSIFTGYKLKKSE